MNFISDVISIQSVRIFLNQYQGVSPAKYFEAASGDASYRTGIVGEVS